MNSFVAVVLLTATHAITCSAQQKSAARTTEIQVKSIAPPDSVQYFTKGLLNGRMWLAMSAPDRVFYVTAFLQGYAISCLYATDDARQQKACYAKLGDIAHTNPVDPHEVVEGVTGVFSSDENQILIIPVAIKAASMKATGEPRPEVDKYLQTERMAAARITAK